MRIMTPERDGHALLVKQQGERRTPTTCPDDADVLKTGAWIQVAAVESSSALLVKTGALQRAHPLREIFTTSDLAMPDWLVSPPAVPQRTTARLPGLLTIVGQPGPF